MRLRRRRQNESLLRHVVGGMAIGIVAALVYGGWWSDPRAALAIYGAGGAAGLVVGSISYWVELGRTGLICSLVLAGAAAGWFTWLVSDTATSAYVAILSGAAALPALVALELAVHLRGSTLERPSRPLVAPASVERRAQWSAVLDASIRRAQR